MAEIIDGQNFLSAKEAGEQFGYTSDYVSKLAREEKIVGKKIGRSWFVTPESLKAFSVTVEKRERERLQKLSEERQAHYQKQTPMPAQSAPVFQEKETVRHTAQHSLAWVLAGTASAAVFFFSFWGTGYVIAQEPGQRLSRTVHQVIDVVAQVDGDALLGASVHHAHRSVAYVHDVHERVTETLAYIWLERDAVTAELRADVRALPRTTYTLSQQMVQTYYGGVETAGSLVYTSVTALRTTDFGTLAQRTVQDGGTSFASVHTALRSAPASIQSVVAQPVQHVQVSSDAQLALSFSLPDIVVAPLSDFLWNNTYTPPPLVPQRIHTVERVTNSSSSGVSQTYSTVPTLSYSGVSESLLNTRLEQLENDIRADLYAFTARYEGRTTANNRAIQLTNVIHNLDGVTITNPTIIGGSISGTSGVGGGGASELSDLSDVASLSPSYGTLFYYDGSEWNTIATSSLGISGTALWSLSGSDVYFSTGNVGIGTSSPYAPLSVVGEVVASHFTATSSATSTFAGGIAAAAFNQTGSATSTFANGINLADGCFAVNGTCITGGGGGGASFGQAFEISNGALAPTTTVGIVVSASSTIQSLSVENGTTTNATSTNLAVTGTASTSNLIVSNTFTLGTVSGFLKATAGTVATSLIDLAADITGILGVANGGTGWGEIQANSILLGNGTSPLATTSAGTNGQVLALVGGVPSWVATTTFSSGLTYSGGNVTADLGDSIDISDETNLAVSATGIELAGDTIALSTNYLIPLSASTTNWNTFYDTPSNRITAGTGLSWGGNTLNAEVQSGDLDAYLSLASWYATTTDGLAEGSTNRYYSSNLFTADLAATTSVASITTLANLSITESQISDLDHYTDTDAADYINASTTILNTNTESGLEAFLTGVTNVFTNNDTIGAANGGTGQDTSGYSGILGINSGTYYQAATTTAGTGLTYSGGAFNVDLGDSIETGEITNGTIVFADLNSTDITLTDFTNDAGFLTNGTRNFTLTTNTFAQSALAPTTTQNLHISGTGTSTFAGGLEAWRQIAAPYFHATSTATSTLPQLDTTGIQVAGNLDIDGTLSFGGVTGSAWSDFCESITGGSGLCDGVDSVGSGGNGLATSTDIVDTYIIYGTSAADVGAEAAFTYDDATDLLTVVNASTTNISASYASSTLGAFGTLSVGSLTGPLAATNGTVAATSSISANYIENLSGTNTGDVTLAGALDYLTIVGQTITRNAISLVDDITGILGVANGGTGWGEIQANSILLGNGTSPLATTSAGTNGQVLALVGGVPSWVATTTFSSPLTYAAGDVSLDTSGTWSGNAGTASALAANGANCSAGNAALGVDASGAAEGCFDVWTEAENTAAAYIALTDLSASWPLTYNSGTGAFAWDGIATSSNLTAGQVLYATGADTFAGVATTSVTIGSGLSYSGTFGNVVGGGSGTLSLDTSGDWTGTIDGNNFAGGAVETGDLLYGSAGGTIAELDASTNGYILALEGGVPTWVATSSINNGVASLQQTYGSAQTGALTIGTSTQSFNGLTMGNTLTNSGTTFTLTPSVSGTLNNSGLTNSTISGVALGANLENLTAGDSSLTFSGAYNGGTARTVSLNTANANDWTALQTFLNASSTLFSAQTAYVGGTATTTIDTAGTITVGGNIVIGGDTINEFAGTGLTVIGNALTADLGDSISAAEIADGDHGDFTYSGGTATLDTGSVSDNEIDYTTVTLTDFTNDAGFLTNGTRNFTLTTNTFAQSALAPTTTQNLHISGTGTSTFAGGLEAWRQIAAPYFHATSTATSTFAGGVNVLAINQTGSATSTFTNGIDLAGGCFSINGTCLSGGGSTVSFGSDNQVPFTNAGGTDFDYSANLTFDGSKLTVTNASTSALSITGGYLDFTTAAATTTIINNNTYAWTIATSTTAAPLLRIDTTAGSEEITIGSTYGASDVYIGASGANSNLVFENAGSYLNWAGTSGESGYGIRDNSGTLQFKNSGGSWANFGSASGEWTDAGGWLYSSEVADAVSIGTTTLSADYTLGLFATSTTADLLFGSSTPSFAGNYVNFVNAAGSPVFTVTSAGRVGVGTSTPGAALDIHATTATEQRLTFSDTSSYSRFMSYENTTPIGYVQSIGSTFAVADRQSDFEFLTQSGDISFWPGLSQAVTFKASGNVGIGTTSPSALLALDDSAPIIFLRDSDTGVTARISADSGLGHLNISADHYGAVSTEAINFQAGGATRLTIDASGRVGVGSTTPNGFVTSQPGATSAMTIGGRTTYQPAFFAQTTSNRNGVLVQVGNNSYSDTGAAAFDWIYPFDTGLTASAKVFRASVGSTLSDVFHVRADGGGYFAGNVSIGTTNTVSKLTVDSADSNIGGTFVSTDAGAYLSFQDSSTTNSSTVYVGATDNRLTFAAGGTTQAILEGDGDLFITSTKTSVGADPLCWDGSGGSYWGDCSSLAQWKTNIETLNAEEIGLDEVLQLSFVSFDWKRKENGELTEGDDYDQLDHDVGFIAEEVAAINYNFGRYDKETGELRDVHERGIMGALVNAVQELHAMVMSALDRITGAEERISELETRLAALEAAVAAGAASGASAGDSEGGETDADTEAPVITIFGNNPATINVGDAYADLGAEVSDNVDQNLGIHTFVDGVAVTSVNLDTSTDATYTITYRATDQAGNVGEATRTVIVGTGTAEPAEPEEEVPPAEEESDDAPEEPAQEEPAPEEPEETTGESSEEPEVPEEGSDTL